MSSIALAIGFADVPDETIDVFHHRGEIGRVAPLARRLAVPPGVPGEDGDVGEIQGIDDILHPARMLVAAVKNHQRLSGRRFGSHAR